MSLAARHVPVPVPVADEVGDYVRSAFERFERLLLAATSSFTEPRSPRDADRALRHLEALVEMLTGLAVGITVSQVSTALRRSFGEPARTDLAQRLAAILRTPPPVIPRVTAHVVGERPLIGELVGRLQPRLCQHAPAAAAMVHALVEELGTVPPSALAMTLRLLGDDDASALAFAQHVQLGWQHYVAALAGAPVPAPPAGGWRRCGEAWHAWSQRIRSPGGAAPRALTQHEVVAEGFVLRIG